MASDTLDAWRLPLFRGLTYHRVTADILTKPMALHIRSTLLLPIELVAFVALIGVAQPHAQSLGDVAKQEQERRKTVKASGKVYTNDDLRGVPALNRPDVDDSAPPDQPDADTKDGSSADNKDGDKAASAAGGKPGDVSKTPVKDAAKDAVPAKDQKYWADRMDGLQAALQRDQSFADALQVQIDALTTDFTNRDDPVQRAQVGDSRQKALDQLSRVKAAIEGDKKAIDDLEDEARLAGAPPGWLR